MANDRPDTIDRILAQWKRERPDLDTAALGVVGRVFRLVQLAEPALSSTLRTRGLQSGWFDLLAALRRAGAPYELNPTELARATMLSSGGLTKRLDRLVEADLVERRPDPTDRRGTLVRLTSRGKEAVDGALAEHVAGEARLLEPLTPAEQRTLDDLLRRLLVGLEEAPDAGG